MIQLMVFLVPCNTVYICCFFGLYFYRCYSGQGAKSFIGGRSIRLCYFDIDEPLHSAVYSFVTFLFRCPYLNWCAVQHGGRMAPLYILLSASCFSPQFSFADLTSACISVVHFLDVCIMCSLKFSLLSIIIPKYLILLNFSKGLLLKYIDTSVLSFLFFLVTTITFDFCSLNVLLLSSAHFDILFTSIFAKFSVSRTFSALTAISRCRQRLLLWLIFHIQV